MQVMEDFVSLAQQLAGFQNKITKEATDRLIVAAESGDLEEVKLAIQMKANPNARDERKTYSWDPLHDPVCGGEACGMEHYGNHDREDDATIINRSFSLSLLQRLREYLSQSFPSFSHQRANGINIADEDRSEEAVFLQTRIDFPPRAQIRPHQPVYGVVDWRQRTPLMLAVSARNRRRRSSSQEVVSFLLENTDADASLVDHKGETALMHAVAEGSLSAVKAILESEKGKEIINMRDSYLGRTAVHFLEKARPAVLLEDRMIQDDRLMGKKGGDDDNAEQWVGIARQLLKAKADVNIQDKQGASGVFHVGYCGTLDVFRVLMEEGEASPTVGQHDGKKIYTGNLDLPAPSTVAMGPTTSRQILIEEGSTEIVAYLEMRRIKKHLDVLKRDLPELRMLHELMTDAAKAERYHGMEMLLCASANPKLLEAKRRC